MFNGLKGSGEVCSCLGIVSPKKCAEWRYQADREYPEDGGRRKASRTASFVDLGPSFNRYLEMEERWRVAILIGR